MERKKNKIFPLFLSCADNEALPPDKNQLQTQREVNPTPTKRFRSPQKQEDPDEQGPLLVIPFTVGCKIDYNRPTDFALHCPLVLLVLTVVVLQKVVFKSKGINAADESRNELRIRRRKEKIKINPISKPDSRGKSKFFSSKSQPTIIYQNASKNGLNLNRPSYIKMLQKVVCKRKGINAADESRNELRIKRKRKKKRRNPISKPRFPRKMKILLLQISTDHHISKVKNLSSGLGKERDCCGQLWAVVKVLFLQ
ncbi:hypothetical protein CEXT_404861 [Caerostris extrusa]|uniref:Uncharacterized protein n=1 Tax=Caerostris extrusa TaxID=172846 RepID=A0AAV4NUJ2_CAEEX|nr:hypothetical protein CEXT_404861 [Caerostris extrusa]